MVYKISTRLRESVACLLLAVGLHLTLPRARLIKYLYLLNEFFSLVRLSYLTKMAMGKSRAACSLLMAFPLTSRMQCLPRSATSFTLAIEVPYRLSLYCPASMNLWF